MGGDETVGERVARGPERARRTGIVWLGIFAGQAFIVAVTLGANALSDPSVAVSNRATGWAAAIAVVTVVAVGIILNFRRTRTARSWAMGLLLAVPAVLVTGPALGLVTCVVGGLVGGLVPG